MSKMRICLLMFVAVVSTAVATPAGFDTVNFVGAELLGRPTDHSVTVTVVPRTAMQVRFEYGTDTTYGQTTPAETTVADTPHFVVISGLAPDTRYYYRMRYRVLASGDSLLGAGRTFHTQRPAGETFTFAVEADPHMVPGEGDTAYAFEATLANIAAANPDFLIDLGDNFMLDKWAVVTTDTIRERMLQYRRWWDQVCHSVPLFIVLGNHEGEQGWDLDSTPTSLPVLLTNGRKPYYPNPVPDGFYSGDSIPEQFVDLRQDYYSWQWGNALFVTLDPYWHTMTKPGDHEELWYWTLGRAQYDWLKQTLEQSHAKFKFVFIHHLVGGNIALGARGGSEYAHYYEWGGLRSDSTWGFDAERPGWGVPIHQLLIDNGVDVVWHGHDHFFAKQDTDGIVYQMVPQPARTRWDSLAHQATQYGYESGVFQGPRGYVRVTMDDTSATMDYIRTFMPAETTQFWRNGMVSYSYTIVKHDTTGTAEVRPPRPLVGFERIAPNPFRGTTLIRFQRTGIGPVQVTIFDALGRRVRALRAPQLSFSVAWDGTDDSGKQVGAGIYHCRFTSGLYSSVARLVLMR